MNHQVGGPSEIKIRSTVRIRCHGPIRRLCAGYAALHTADDAAEGEDAAAEPGCAALARLSAARYRLVVGPGCGALASWHGLRSTALLQDDAGRLDLPPRC